MNVIEDKSHVTDTHIKSQILRHIEICRSRIPDFVKDSFYGTGAFHLNRRAFGLDILIAPYNFFMGMPNFIMHTLAVILNAIGVKRAASWLHRCHPGLPTKVQETLRTKILSELLDVSPRDADAKADNVKWIILNAAHKPVQIYLQTRNVAADITAGTLAAIVGLVFLSRFTPGSISAGTVVAELIAREEAVSQFMLGDELGRIYYSLLPVHPSSGTIALALFLVVTVIAVVAAFSGFIHDPLQAVTGLHKRKLNRLLDAIEASATDANVKNYRPKDTLIGRIYDLVDWAKGLMSF